MSIVDIEQVMVVKTELFRQCGYFQGFSDKIQDYLPVLLDPANTQYLPRDRMEQDPSFKQLIPYCIFQLRHQKGDTSVFQYRRGSGQGESRLHKKRSIGIGGHISTLDVHESCAYQQGMKRELEEEIEIETDFQQQQVGLINDDSNEVGKVHLGVVHLFTVDKPLIRPRENEILEAGFVPVRQLLDEIDDFETWSQICLQALFSEGRTGNVEARG